MERDALDRQVAEATASGDARREETARAAADERNMQLELLPSDLAGMVRELQRYDFTSAEAAQRFEELVELLARRMAAMQSLLASMTPEQRAQIAQLAEQLLDDMDLRWQVDQLGAQLRGAFPDMGWDRRYDFTGQDPLGLAEAASTLEDLGDLDRLEQLLRGASHPGALAEADIDRARELLGDDAARSLDELARLTRMLQDAGLIDQREGRLELTPKGLRKIGHNALHDLFQRLARDKLGNHELERSG